jgi:hypothetical protein
VNKLLSQVSHVFFPEHGIRNWNLLHSSHGDIITTLLLNLGKSDISDKSFCIFCMIIIAVEDEQAERETHISVEFYHHDGTVVIRSPGLFGCEHEI